MKLRRTLLARMIRAALLAWLIAMVIGCASKPQMVAQQYVPPRIDCQQQATPDVPAWPTLWWLDGPAWAIETLGVLTLERELRAKEQDCIAALKVQGIVR